MALTGFARIRRQENPVDRPDIIGRILDVQGKEGTEFSIPFIAAQLSDVVIAGTDTTATALSTAHYYLMRHHDVMQTLRSEIRTRFQRYEDISPATTADLPYVTAVLNEALRMLAPVAWPPARLVPPGGDTVDGYFLPADVSGIRSAHLLLLSISNPQHHMTDMGICRLLFGGSLCRQLPRSAPVPAGAVDL